MSERLFVHPAEARRRFQDYASGPITDENLTRGALLIALEENPTLLIEEELAQLDELAGRVLRRSMKGEPSVFRLGHLHAEMFDVDGYRGDDESYFDPRNALLDQVIQRRRGLPISLSILFLHVASQVALRAFGVGLPGHYVVKVQFELNEIFIDPFRGGETLSVQEIAATVKEMSDGKMTLRSEHLRSWTGRQTLIRLLGNLQNMWGRLGDRRRSVGAAERMELLESMAAADDARSSLG